MQEQKIDEEQLKTMMSRFSICLKRKVTQNETQQNRNS